MNGPEATRPSLPRVLGVLDGVAMVVGVVIGLGILRTPGLIAGHLGGPWLILGTWTVAGVMVAFSTLVFAELGAMLPQAGGKYVYARAAFGDAVGFAIGASELLGVRAFLAASKAVVIGGYAVDLLGRGDARVITGTTVVLFFLLHLLGLKTGAIVQNTITLVKVLFLLAIVVLCFQVGDGASWKAAWHPTGSVSFLGFALAYQAIWFTYYGWEDFPKMAEDVREPSRNLPRILLGGTAITVVLYLLLNVAYLDAMTPAAQASSSFVARDAIARALGNAAGITMTLGGLFIVAGGLNANFMGMPRIPFAMARDRLAPAALGGLDRRGTPVAALAFIAILVFGLAVSGGVEWLIRVLTFVALVVDGTVLAGFFVLRRRRPDAARPFHVPFYPLLPAVVVGMYGAILTLVVATQPRLALGGTGLIGTCALVGWVLSRRARIGR